MGASDGTVSNNGWDELRANQLYRPYQLPEHARAWSTRVLSRPGCFAVVADAHYGKTALLRHLWEQLLEAGYEVAGYIFERQQRNQLADAILELRSQLAKHGLLAAGPSSVYWPKIEQAAEAGPPIAVLIDALDEIDRDQWCQLDALLPTFALGAAKLVVTSRLPLAEYNTVFGALVSAEALLGLETLSANDTAGLALQAPSPEARALASQIHGRTGGLPWQIAAILRSGNPAAALELPPGELGETQRIVRLDLADMERQAGKGQAALLGRLLALLAVAPHALAFDELRSILALDDAEARQLRRLCERLARHVGAGGAYRLVSPDVQAHISQDAERLGVYAADVRAMRERVAEWYRRRYNGEQGNSLRTLPRHVLRHAPRYLLAAAEPTSFEGERIFADARWRDALDDGFETIAALREVVRATWRAAEQHPEPCSRILGATTCAVVQTSLVAAFSPAMVAALVHRGIVDERQAREYARAYGSADGRAAIEQLLRDPRAIVLEPADLAAVEWVAQHGQAHWHRALNRLHRERARVGELRRDDLLKALRDELVLLPGEAPAAGPGASPAGRPLPALVGALREALAVEPLAPAAQPPTVELSPAVDLGGPLGLTYWHGLSYEHTALLSEIASVWTPDEPDGVEHYLELTRLLASGTRAAYFDALITLAPAIGQVFGPAYLQKLAAIITTITTAYR